MFSTSILEEDVIKSYSESANSYITKSFNTKNLFEKIATMGEYWLKTSIIAKADNIYIIKNKEKNGEKK